MKRRRRAAHFVGLHDGGVFGEHARFLPIGQAAVAEILQVVRGDLGKMGFVADVIRVRNDNLPLVTVALESNAGVLLLEVLNRPPAMRIRKFFRRRASPS